MVCEDESVELEVSSEEELEVVLSVEEEVVSEDVEVDSDEVDSEVVGSEDEDSVETSIGVVIITGIPVVVGYVGCVQPPSSIGTQACRGN